MRLGVEAIQLHDISKGLVESENDNQAITIKVNIK